jgi:hypothetical protein
MLAFIGIVVGTGIVFVIGLLAARAAVRQAVGKGLNL